MFLVVFEVIVREAFMDQYLELAAGLKETLLSSGGLLSSERFQSLADQRKLLSLSVWDSLESIDRWRQQMDHRLTQKTCRDNYFESYRITFASALRSYTEQDRRQAPEDSNQYFFEKEIP